MSPELIRYAEAKVARKKWRSGASLPKGLEAPDLVGIVIEKTLDAILGENLDTARTWNEEENPDLVDHLKAAIDSEASNLVRLNEHKRTNYSAGMNEEEADELLEHALSKARPSETPEDILMEKERRITEKKEFDEFFKKLCAHLEDNENASLVLMSYQELADSGKKVKPQVVAENLSMDIDDVRNAIKVIRRAANSIDLDTKGGRK